MKESQRHKTAKKGLDHMWAPIARELADAGIVGFPQIGDSRLRTTRHSRLRISPSPALGYRIMSKRSEITECRLKSTCGLLRDLSGERNTITTPRHLQCLHGLILEQISQCRQ